MAQELFVELKRDGQELPHVGESPIRQYQHSTGCTLEEALAQMGFTLDSYISGGPFNFCRLYIRGRRSSSGETSTFCDGYIDVSFHATDEAGEPLHHSLYVDDFLTWAQVIGMLTAPGGHIHGWARHGSEEERFR